MTIEIKHEKFKEIVERLDAGMICFYDKINGELQYYPYGLEDLGGEDPWAELKGKIEAYPDHYFQIEIMSKGEAFEVIKNFTDEIIDVPTRKKFIGIISGKKTLSHFDNLLSNYPDLKNQWLAFKLEKYIEFIKLRVRISNLIDDPITGFYIHLEYHLSRTLQSPTDIKLRRHFWCDGVYVPDDSLASIQNVIKTRQIETQAWIGQGPSFEEIYKMTIKLGPCAIKNYTNGLSMIDCLPSDESLDWVKIDTEKKTIELQLN